MCGWSEVTTWEGWENNEVVVGEVGNVMRWQFGREVRWERWEGSEVAR